MSEIGVRRLVNSIMSDADYRHFFFSNSEQVMSGYDLSDEEALALQRLTSEDFNLILFYHDLDVSDIPESESLRASRVQAIVEPIISAASYYTVLSTKIDCNLCNATGWTMKIERSFWGRKKQIREICVGCQGSGELNVTPMNFTNIVRWHPPISPGL